MRLLIVFIGFILTGACNSVFANDYNRQSQFQSFLSVLGPVSVGHDQNLKVCSTDISVITKLGVKDEEKFLSKRNHKSRNNTNRVVWSSTRVEVFDSADTTRPLQMSIDDIIFSSGKGGCTSIPGYNISVEGLSRSVVIVLTTVTEAKAAFNPLVSGELRAPGNTSAASLLLPAVQSVRGGSGGGGGGGGSTPGSGSQCCACAPVCGCGFCD